jgi:hypothetical protein
MSAARGRYCPECSRWIADRHPTCRFCSGRCRTRAYRRRRASAPTAEGRRLMPTREEVEQPKQEQVREPARAIETTLVSSSTAPNCSRSPRSLA